MGSPLSGLLADIYLDFYENNYILNNNIFANNIIFYGRYVDDTFLIFNGTLRQISNLKNHMNTITHNIQFTMETETNNQLNFLDLTITRQLNSLNFKIYRKPTTTNVIIHGDSHHPLSQKLAAYNSFIHRLLMITLNNDDFECELNIIKHIAMANGYESQMIDNILRKHKSRRSRQTHDNTPNNKYSTSQQHTLS